MALIIRKLWDGMSKKEVTMAEVDMSKVEKEFETDKAKVYSYETNSNPAGDYDSYGPKIVYKGDFEDIPVFKVNDGGDVEVDRRELSDFLVDRYGSGQYSVFKFGGSPCWEPYLENCFIEAKKEEDE